MDSILDTRIVDVQWIRNGYMAGVERVTRSAAVFRSLAPLERDKVMNSARLTFGSRKHCCQSLYQNVLRHPIESLIAYSKCRKADT